MIKNLVALAVLGYSHDDDVAGHRSLLAQHSIDCEPLDTAGLAGTMRGVPVLYLLSASWWRELTERERQSLLTEMQRPSSAVIVTGRAGEDVPLDLEGLGLVSAWIDTPTS